ncbi:hypothetical protein [Edaphobacter modestus]|uniref:hypothetical protein n=1 Tax=Edaphobacter modestus TaxID=388466 RepID=UPI00102BA559|nr:hypothetical protein [Edaphobacter modestus]
MNPENVLSASSDTPVSAPTSTNELTLGGPYSAAAWAITKWVGGNVAGGIVSSVGGLIFSEVMSAIGMGGPDMAEISRKLDAISNQLTEVQRSLDRLTAMTAEILKQLNALRDFMEKSLKIETLLAARSRIDVAYGNTSSQSLENSETTGRPISLRLLTEKMPHFTGITQADLEAAARDFAAYVADVPGCIETIRVVLVKAALGQTSLLMHWAKELGQQVRDNKITRENACMVLEGYFLYAVSAQLKGLCVHGVALGTDRRLGPQFIQQYLQDDFAEVMREETSAYVEAVEYLIFSSLDPIMLTGMKDCMDEREFPKYVDELLLRADLLSAALRLVGHKGGPDGKPSPTVQAAIQGIYGRALFRPSDLKDGKPLDIHPNGYTPAQGTELRELPFSVLDFVESGGKATLRDVGTTFTNVAHYFLSFPSPMPGVGTEIDKSFRGGVTPKLFPVFGEDNTGVLAAGLFDPNRLCRGLPSGAKQEYRFNPFPYDGGGTYITFHDQKCESKRHPLTNDAGDVYSVTFNVKNIHKGDNAHSSSTYHRLFNYTGKTVKVRLWAHVTTRLRADPRKDISHGTAFAQDYDVCNRLDLQFPDGKWKEFYNSFHSWGNNKPVSLNGNETSKNLDVSRSRSFNIDFDLVPGEYHLVLDNGAYFRKADHSYDGWQSTTLDFTLRALTLEMIGATT